MFKKSLSIIVLFSFIGCGTVIMIPPAIDLSPQERIGLISFSIENAKGNLDEMATQRFLQVITSYHSVQVIELGSLDDVLGKINKRILDLDAVKAVGEHYDVNSFFYGKINVSDVNDTIETAVGGKITSWLIEGRKRFAIQVRFPYEKRKDTSALENILIPSPEGYQVPLKQLAKIREIEGPAQISHEKNMRRIVVECNIRNRDMGSFVKEVQQEIKTIEESLSRLIETRASN